MGVLATDDFNRADSTDLGPTWDVIPGWGNCQIVSNQVRSTAADGEYHGESYNDVTWPADQYAQVVFDRIEYGTAAGPVLRASTTEATAYFTRASNSALRLYKVVNGTYTELASYESGVNAGDIVREEVEGTTLRLYQNDVLRLSTTDSSIASGRAGLTTWVNVGQPLYTLRIDDWEGGDFGSTATQSRFRFRLDDGGESAATWAADENTNITEPAGTARRLRVQLDTAGDHPAMNVQLEYRRKDQGGGWMIVRTS